MPKRAILYARVSGDDRRNATSSIQSQIADCRRYCEQRGYQIVGEAVEEPNRATSGADWLPELDCVLTLAPSHTFDVLVCREVDRLARNRFKQMATEIELERHGVFVEYAVGQFEDSDEGRLLKGLVSEFAEYERGKTRRRTMGGTLRSVQAGNVTVGGMVAPYGYDPVTETDPATGKGRRNFVINEVEAAIIEQIFQMYASGATLHAICAWLDEHKVPLPGKGNNRRKQPVISSWSVGTLGRILKNRTYTGTWHYRKTRTHQDPVTRNRISTPRAQEEWIEIAVPAIITEDSFNAVQRRKQVNKLQMGRQRKHTYSLGGMMTCGHCSKSSVGIAKLSSSRKSEYRYYACAANHNPRQYGYKCIMPYCRADAVEAAVWVWVKSLLLDPDTLHRHMEEYQQTQQNGAQPLLAMIESSQARRGELEVKKERLVKAYMEGVFSLDDIASQKTVLDKEIANVTQAIATLQAEADPKLLSAEHIKSIEAMAAEVRDGVEEADSNLEAQRKIFRLLDVNVILNYDADSKEHWADASCIFNTESFPMGSHTLLCAVTGAMQHNPAP